MPCYSLGLNHERAPLGLRERFALDEASLRALYDALPLDAPAELVLLATCNRTEAHFYGTPEDAARVRRALAHQAGVPWPTRFAFHLEGTDAARHIVEVTCGLRSRILGDAQIFSQVKAAYRTAQEAGRLGPVLHRLFHHAFRAAKQVATETGLTHGAASAPGVAVAAAAAFLGRLPASRAGRRALVVGAGAMGQRALQALARHRLEALLVTNRHAARAAAAARTAGAQVVPWKDRHAVAGEVDVVIVATGAPEPVLEAALLPDRTTAALLVDLAVPRNIDPAAADRPGYRVLDLDRLAGRLASEETARRQAVPTARRCCGDAVAAFDGWLFHHEALQPAIHALRDTFETIRTHELAQRAERVSPNDRRELDGLTRSILQKLLAVPVAQLKTGAHTSRDLDRAAALLQALFERTQCEEKAFEEQLPLPRANTLRAA